MKTVLMLLIMTVLFSCLVSGVVLKLAIVIIKITGQIALTQAVCWGLYILATLIVVCLLWLFVKIGGK